MHSALHTHETKTTYLHLFFSANVDAINVHNACVLASSMWFTAEFQILVVVALFKLPELGVHWFCESRLAQHEKLHKCDASESNIFCCLNCDYRTICKRYMADHTKLKHIQSGNGQFICTQGSCFQKPTIYDSLSQDLDPRIFFSEKIIVGPWEVPHPPFLEEIIVTH